MTLQLGILFALLCAIGSNLAFFFKHRGACSAPSVDVRRPLHTAAELWSSKWFAIGMGVGGLAWLLHVAALSLAPMSTVQAVVAGPSGTPSIEVTRSVSSASPKTWKP